VNLVLQFVGALGILLPFVLFQLGRMSQHAYPYLVCNVVGSAVLTVVAYLDGQWGFVIVQAVWTLAAAVGIARRLTWRTRGETME
jgi:hypothetical protein